MKPRNFLTLTLALGLIAGASAMKMDICHNTANNPHTINISIFALPAHMAHGDDFPDHEDSPCYSGTVDTGQKR